MVMVMAMAMVRAWGRCQVAGLQGPLFSGGERMDGPHIYIELCDSGGNGLQTSILPSSVLTTVLWGSGVTHLIDAHIEARDKHDLPKASGHIIG